MHPLLPTPVRPQLLLVDDVRANLLLLAKALGQDYESPKHPGHRLFLRHRLQRHAWLESAWIYWAERRSDADDGYW